MITGFSADWVMISPDGAVLSTSKLYKTPEAYRMDGMPMGGAQFGMSGNITSLGLYAQKKEYLYNHDKKLVFETELDEQEMMEMLNLFKNVESEVVLGKENVSGYACIKKKVTTTATVMGMKETSTQIIWQSDRFEMPLRTRSEEGYVSELRNIKTKKPAADLFKPLTGYAKVDNMMAVLGMDFSDMDPEEPFEKTPGEDIRDLDPEKFMAAMEELMGGEGSDPEKAAQLREIFTQALAQAREMDVEPGAAEDMWKIVPKRPGDRVGGEFRTGQTYSATLGSQASVEDVCDFYEKKLIPEGWQTRGRSVHNGQGFMLLSRGEYLLRISSAENPGMDETFVSFYNLQLSANPYDAPPSTQTAVTPPPATAPLPRTPESPGKGLLFPNSDFEHGDLTNWTGSGDAFHFQPTKGDNPTARHRGQPSNHQGDFWIGTYEKYQGYPGQEPGEIQGDQPTGTLTSIPFRISGDRIGFLIGGGKRLDSLYVALVIDGAEVLKATGSNHESMISHLWDVTAYKGKEARILISDQFSGGWGHINADDFRYGTGE